ncbi:MAG: DUF2586 family protein [bacterium]|nr:DUF2586 family protein [bacterium]
MGKIIKDVYTEYFSGKAGMSQKPTAIECVAGAAGGGDKLTRYIISDKRSALDLFKSGPLLQALLERLDAGSTVIYALRLAGSAMAKATMSIPGATGTAFTLDGYYPGTWWNGVSISITANGADRTIEIVDPDTDVVYSFTATSNAALVAAINAGQSLVKATIGAGGLVAAKAAANMAGGNDGLTLANGDYTAGITASEDFTDVNWVHFVGADTLTLWAAILTSCNTMVTSNLGERFAFLDVPRMVVADPLKPTAAETSTYVTTIQTLIATVADQNAVIPVGEARYTDMAGTVYWNRITSAVAGRVAALKVQESLLAKSAPNVSKLCPEWNVGQQTLLVTEHLIHMRNEPGLGLIFGLSDNRCPEGSAYNRVEKVRATYAAGKACRLAALPHLGKPNDSAGEGLLLMETDMRQPLSLMAQKGEIDHYDLQLTSTDEMRALGEVEAHISINSMKAFEIILEKVYLD